MDPGLAAALPGLVTALTTFVLMAAAYFYGPNQRGARRDARENRDEWAQEDEVRRESRRNQDVERDFHRRHINEEETTDE